jgi:hypothetical protein
VIWVLFGTTEMAWTAGHRDAGLAAIIVIFVAGFM